MILDIKMKPFLNADHEYVKGSMVSFNRGHILFTPDKKEIISFFLLHHISEICRAGKTPGIDKLVSASLIESS